MTLEEFEKIVVDYMDSFNTMTLSCSKDGQPWSAPVYYARQEFDLIFFSSRKSMHSQVLEVNPRAAVSIYGHYDRWRDIRGLQISGKVDSLGSTVLLVGGAKTYFKRYPFATDFFSKAGFVSDVISKRTRIMLYAFRSETIHYLDNSVEFGVRWRVDIQDGRLIGPPVKS